MGAEALRAVAYELELAATNDTLQDAESLQAELELQLSRLAGALTLQTTPPGSSSSTG